MSERIMTEAGNPRKAAAAMPPREVADRHQQAADQRQGRVLTSRCGQVLPQPRLDHPQVGSLTGEGRAMDDEQAGKRSPKRRRK